MWTVRNLAVGVRDTLSGFAHIAKRTLVLQQLQRTDKEILVHYTPDFSGGGAGHLKVVGFAVRILQYVFSEFCLRRGE